MPIYIEQYRNGIRVMPGDPEWKSETLDEVGNDAEHPDSYRGDEKPEINYTYDEYAAQYEELQGDRSATAYMAAVQSLDEEGVDQYILGILKSGGTVTASVTTGNCRYLVMVRPEYVRMIRDHDGVVFPFDMLRITANNCMELSNYDDNTKVTTAPIVHIYVMEN